MQCRSESSFKIYRVKLKFGIRNSEFGIRNLVNSLSQMLTHDFKCKWG
jgi:hypothetical protein